MFLYHEHRDDFNMTEEKDQDRAEMMKKDQNIKEEIKENSLESILEEQSRNQIRSDYRRSLGGENRRRYMD